MSINITVAGTAYPSPSSASDIDWAAQQVALLQALASAASNGTWTACSLVNSWANVGGYQAMQYRVNSQGDVGLRGRISSGSSATVCTTLPTGSRPAHDIIFNATNVTGISRVVISTNGTIIVTTLTGDSTIGTVFDGITFSTL